METEHHCGQNLCWNKVAHCLVARKQRGWQEEAENKVPSFFPHHLFFCFFFFWVCFFVRGFYELLRSELHNYERNVTSFLSPIMGDKNSLILSLSMILLESPQWDQMDTANDIWRCWGLLRMQILFHNDHVLQLEKPFWNLCFWYSRKKLTKASRMFNHKGTVLTVGRYN